MRHVWFLMRGLALAAGCLAALLLPPSNGAGTAQAAQAVKQAKAAAKSSAATSAAQGYAEAVAGEHGPPLALVPDDDRELAPQPFGEGGPVAFVQVGQHLGVAAAGEAVAGAAQLGA